MIDLLALANMGWPNVTFYQEQVDIIRSVERDDETYVPAGNMLGKDYVAGFISLGTFIVSLGTVRVVCTSVKDDHLRVLWGEIMRFVDTCEFPLRVEDGGCLVVTHHDIRRVVGGKLCPVSYLRCMVSAKGEGMQGHHATHTLGVIDEASAVEDIVYDMMETWAKRKLIIGNPMPCTNFFKRGVLEGDLLAV